MYKLISPVAEIDDVLTLREKLVLEAASTKVSVTELVFGNELTSLKTRVTSATTDPFLQHKYDLIIFLSCFHVID